MTVQLSAMAACGKLDIVRDGSFATLGGLSCRGRGVLVVYYDPKFITALLANPSISAVITCHDLVEQLPANVAVAIADDPKLAFYRVHNHLLKNTDFYGCEQQTRIASSANVHPAAYVDANGVQIGAGCVVEPGAIVLSGTEMGDSVIIRAGAVIGGEGFEPKMIGGEHVIVRHAGGVKLGDRVEIQANSHVAKSLFVGNTEIGEDTKVDALVHVAHGVRIGRRCEIAAGAIIAGSATIGDDVWIGPNACISSEIHVGDGAFVAIGTTVTRDVPAGERVIGRNVGMRKIGET